MKNSENYFDKFVEDLEKREALAKQRLSSSEEQLEQWRKRMALERSYREHAHERIRYKK